MGFKLRSVLLWGQDSSLVLFSMKRRTEREQPALPSLPTQACAHLVTTHHIWGFQPHSTNEVRGNPTTQKCLRIVSSFSDQVIKRMSMCPKSPKMEPNLTGLQSFNGIQLNILPLFTPHPLSNNHNLMYKLQPSLRVWASQIIWVCWFK